MGNGKTKAGKHNYGGGRGEITIQELDALASAVESEIAD